MAGGLSIGEKQGWQRYSRLIPAFRIPDSARCICAAGAGGKTGTLYRLADEYRERGRKVLLTTTTKMYLPERYQALDKTAGEILERLDRDGFVVAGSTVSREKMGPLPPEIWREIMPAADMVLVEADGSRRLPLKVPGAGEPVLPAEWDFLIVVEGMSGIGRPLREVCHRLEQASALLNCGGAEKVTEETAALLARKGYRSFLNRTGRTKGEGKPTKQGESFRSGCCFLNQADCLEERQRERIAEAMEGTEFVLGSIQENFYLRKI